MMHRKSVQDHFLEGTKKGGIKCPPFLHFISNIGSPACPLARSRPILLDLKNVISPLNITSNPFRNSIDIVSSITIDYYGEDSLPGLIIIHT